MKQQGSEGPGLVQTHNHMYYVMYVYVLYELHIQ